MTVTPRQDGTVAVAGATSSITGASGVDLGTTGTVSLIPEGATTGGELAIVDWTSSGIVARILYPPRPGGW